ESLGAGCAAPLRVAEQAGTVVVSGVRPVWPVVSVSRCCVRRLVLGLSLPGNFSAIAFLPSVRERGTRGGAERFRSFPLWLPRRAGEAPGRAIPLHRADARAVPGGGLARQAGSLPFLLDGTAGILGRAACIPGEVSGFRRPKSRACGYAVLLEAVHGFEPGP